MSTMSSGLRNRLKQFGRRFTTRSRTNEYQNVNVAEGWENDGDNAEMVTFESTSSAMHASDAVYPDDEEEEIALHRRPAGGAAASASETPRVHEVTPEQEGQMHTINL